MPLAIVNTPDSCRIIFGFLSFEAIPQLENDALWDASDEFR